MKKNISINISGIIFHIEEDGYEKLKSYLDSVSAYFSAYEDSREIVEDIENRIAEIFLVKLNDNKQVISLEDVEDLISTMGTTRDFDATIDTEQEDFAYQQEHAGASREKEPVFAAGAEAEADGKLRRDLRRKLLGGVAAGLGRYFKIDPVWIRILLLAVTVLSVASGDGAGIGAFMVLLYFVLWVILPGRIYEEYNKTKKLYRDPDNKVLGGVASGLSNYFGVDIAIVRLLFIIGIFLGFTGPILYVILWIIVPQASSITEKIEMQGEPVTLSSIEHSIKKELNEDGVQEESVLLKILLFPFRLVALVFKAISKFLGPLLKFIVDIVRIVFGAALTVTGFATVVATFAFLISYYGGLSDLEMFNINNYRGSADILQGVVDPATLIFGVILSLVSSLFLIILGLSIILKRWVIKPYLGWTLLGLWLIGSIGFAFALPNNIMKFSSRDGYQETKVFTLADQTPVLKLYDNDDGYGSVELKLRGHRQEDFKLLLNYTSNGRNRREAEENARAIRYNVTQQDSIFTFNSGITTDPGDNMAMFQEVSAIFYIPYNRPFMMDRDLGDILRNTLHIRGYRSYQMEGNTWVFSDEGRLTCLTCEDEPDDRNYRRQYDDNDFSLDNYSGTTTDLDLGSFSSIDASGVYDIKLEYGDSLQIKVKGQNRYLKDSDIYVSGNTLRLDYDSDYRTNSRYNRIAVQVILPAGDAPDVVLSGNSKLFLDALKADDLTVKLSGNSEIEGTVDLQALNLDADGSASLNLKGFVNNLNLEISGGADYNGRRLKAVNATVYSKGASTTDVYATDEMVIDASGVSKVYYAGSNNVKIQKTELARVNKQSR